MCCLKQSSVKRFWRPILLLFDCLLKGDFYTFHTSAYGSLYFVQTLSFQSRTELLNQSHSINTNFDSC